MGDVDPLNLPDEKDGADDNVSMRIVAVCMTGGRLDRNRAMNVWLEYPIDALIEEL